MDLQTKKSFLLFTILLVLGQYGLLAQASFSAKISPSTIGKNETAELRLMIDNARQVDQIIPPSLSDFIVLSGPNQESGMESTNGVTRQYIGLTYILKPKATGKFIIRSALAKADGKMLRSNQLTIEVTKNATGNSQSNNLPGFGGPSLFDEPAVESSFNDFIIRKNENIAEKINKNIFIKVDVSRSSCYVGEPVTVTYKLYTRLKSESSIIKNPSFNGFSVIDLLPPGNTYYSVEKLGGREYNVYTLRKSQLYPLQAGQAELESVEVENNIHFIKEEYLNQQRNGLDDMFRDFSQTTIPAEGMHDEKVTLQSKPAMITVKPLPAKDSASSFNGAVGEFTIDAQLEKTSFTTDDAGKLVVSISGQGNMTMIIAPDITWPEGVESYDPRAKEQLNKLVVPISGTKYFEYPFTISKAGSYQLAPIKFSFFDVKDGKYKTVSTGPLAIQVAKGTGRKTARPGDNLVQAPAHNFWDTIFSNRWLIIVPVGIFMLVGLLIWLQKDKRRHRPVKPATIAPEETTPVEENNGIPVNPFILSEEKMVQHDPRGFYEALNNELRCLLANKFQLPLATIHKKKIAEEADKKGVSVHTSLQIQQLLDDIEWQLYTPFAADDKMQDMHDTANSIAYALNNANL